MNIINKFKETALSVLPVIFIVLALGLTVVPLDKFLLCRFIFGGFLLIIGLTIFLLGVDLGIQPVGERCGAELTKKRNLSLLLICALIIGFVVTVAEPDIQVFGTQVKNLFSSVNKTLLTFAIAAGVGVFMVIGLLRSVLNFSIKISFIILYIVLFIIAFLVKDCFVGIAFDSGGATTGPMTVPFIMALGLGVSSVRENSEDSFGLTGIASIGPVMAVLIYSFFINANVSSNVVENISSISEETIVVSSTNFFSEVFTPFGNIIGHVITDSLVSIVPLFVLVLIFQFILLKMTARQFTRITIGFIYSFLGLTIFLAGVNGGFMQAGAELGKALGEKAIIDGGVWYILLIGTGFVLGAIIVCAEPAVWVLSQQVESVSGGTIKRKVLLIFLSIGTALAISVSMIRGVIGFNIMWILIPGYFLSMILMIFCPDMFTGIAFDSGGVASGPLTSTFVLSFALGASSGGSGVQDSFGVIALVAMMPLIAIQFLGIIFKFSKNRGNKK